MALGSDFDGATMSQHLGDASGLLKLLAEIEQAPRARSERDVVEGQRGRPGWELVEREGVV